MIDPLGLLRQLAGALREGGVLFVSVPRLDTLPAHGDLAYCISGRRHVVCFSETCWTGLLARAGFASTAGLDAKEPDVRSRKESRCGSTSWLHARHHPLRPPDAPLAPAVEALTRHARAGVGLAARVRATLPVRVHGARLDRAVERRARERRRAAQ